MDGSDRLRASELSIEEIVDIVQLDGGWNTMFRLFGLSFEERTIAEKALMDKARRDLTAAGLHPGGWKADKAEAAGTRREYMVRLATTFHEFIHSEEFQNGSF